MPRKRSRSSRRLVAAACVAAASTLLLPGRQARGWETSDFEPFIAHLEFQGYACKVEDGQILARHPTHNNLIVKPLGGGFLVRAGFVGKTPAELPRDAYVI